MTRYTSGLIAMTVAATAVGTFGVSAIAAPTNINCTPTQVGVTSNRLFVRCSAAVGGGILTCGINGSYSYSGLSGKDALSIHILYPEDDHAATFFGKTVVREKQLIWLVSEWRIRSAYMPFVVKSALWTVDGKMVSDKPDLNITLPPGEHPFVYSYRDFLDRQYTQRGTLRVLTADDYVHRISGPVAARSALQ